MGVGVLFAAFALEYIRYKGRSKRDDGRWAWQDTLHRDSRSSSSSRRYEPSPLPKFLGASPDSRLVFPWLGDHTPHSAGMVSVNSNTGVVS
uniref:Uncharacterized protein n=1 Tax=Solanum lycopersicum TaxID=4081 RepID=A0A3Q7J8G6_SOLLC